MLSRGKVNRSRPPRTPSAPATKTLDGFPFPQELVDLIVDCLEDDMSSLEGCSLTSRAFLASSRRYQFYEIELTGIPPPYRTRSQKQTLCDKFLALITKSPHIALLVKDLTILEGGAPWLANRRSPLPLVLRRLVNLEHVSIGDPAGRFMDWSLIPHRVRESLSDILHSPKIQSVTLTLIEELPHPTKLFPAIDGSSLKEINLMGVTLEDEVQNSVHLPTPSFPLESLKLVIFGEQLVIFLDHFKNMQARLRSLKVYLANLGDLAPAWECIERSTALGELSVAMLWRDLHGTSTFANHILSPH